MAHFHLIYNEVVVVNRIKINGIKLISLTMILFIGLLSGVSVNSAESQDQAIIDRIKPAGEVCVEGKDCGNIAVASTPAASSAARSGEDIYKASCFGCHGTGVAGAPKFGDAAAWKARSGAGLDGLTKSAIAGKGAMPPRGTCASCSDDDIKAAIKYMLDNSK